MNVRVVVVVVTERSDPYGAKLEFFCRVFKKVEFDFCRLFEKLGNLTNLSLQVAEFFENSTK